MTSTNDQLGDQHRDQTNIESNVGGLRARVIEDFPRVIAMLTRKIALKSISSQGITGAHMRSSAEFVADQLHEVGIDAHVVQSTNPDGTAGAYEVVGSRIVDPQAPTVLLYAHHDVQPVPDPSAWHTDPFVATTIADRLFGRGSCDDAGGIAIHSGALHALGDELPVNIKVFIEGEEEMGSPSFIPFIEAHREEFAADVIIVADSGNWAPDVPSLTTSLRGNTTLDVHVRVLSHPVHSGQYGGPILDAHTLAAMLISSMYDRRGDLIIPGLHAGEPVGGLQRDLDETAVRRDASVVDSYRLVGTGSLASRLWTKPSATVIGMDAPAVDDSFNVIADETRFRLSVRTAPGQRPEQAQQAVSDFLIAHAPHGAQVDVTPLENGMGWAMDPKAEASRDAVEALRQAYGVDPINKGEGGSIPFIPELQRIFPHAQVLVTGPEDPISNAHSPNESVSLSGLQNDILAEALLLRSLGSRSGD